MSFKRAQLAAARNVPFTFLMACAAMLLSPADARAQITTASEYNLKAVYLYSFGRFATWPDHVLEASDDVVVGIYGDSPITVPLQHVAGTRKIHGRPIRIQQFDSPQEYASCQIVFVAAAVAEEDRDNLLAELKAKPILLVGETDDFTSAGGMIGFFLNADTVRFEINIDSVKHSGLVLDAKLLRLGVAPKSND